MVVLIVLPHADGHDNGILDVGGVYVGDMDAQVGCNLGQQAAGAPIQVIPSHYTIAGAHQPQDCRKCCHATGKGKRLISSLADMSDSGSSNNEE